MRVPVPRFSVGLEPPQGVGRKFARKALLSTVSMPGIALRAFNHPVQAPSRSITLSSRGGRQRSKQSMTSSGRSMIISSSR